MAFEIDRQDPCVAVDKELGLIRIQDVSARTIYQGNIFDIYRNILSLLNNKEPNAPINFYKNAFMGNYAAYQEFIETKAKLCNQFYTLGSLKTRGLPIVLPDVDSFVKKFQEINNQNCSDNDFRILVEKEAKRFKEAVEISVESNLATAKQNNISLTKPKEVEKGNTGKENA